jgi:glycosyltransferase involved in cell wall biosynthesis
VRPLHFLVANVFFRPYSYGGATLVAEWMAAELARRGHRVSAVSAMPQPKGVPAYSILRGAGLPGVESYLLALPPGRSRRLSEENPAVDRALAPLIDALAPDIAHLHSVQDLGAGLLGVMKSQGIPAILSFHDFWWLCARQFMLRPGGAPCLLDRIEAEACAACVGPSARDRLARLTAIARLADLRTAPSRFAAGLCERSGLGPVRVWENGILPPGPQPPRPERPFTFGYAGGPSAQKGWPLLREAACRIGRTDFAVHAVDGGVFEPWWRPGMLDGLKGAWRIVPRYAPEAADAFYAGIDTLIFPSQWRETYGLTIREALARGKGLIRTEGGGQEEHPLAPRVRTLPIGASPERLAVLMEEAIAEGAAQASGTPTRAPRDQADELLAMAGEILGKARGVPATLCQQSAAGVFP